MLKNKGIINEPLICFCKWIFTCFWVVIGLVPSIGYSFSFLNDPTYNEQAQPPALTDPGIRFWGRNPNAQRQIVLFYDFAAGNRNLNVIDNTGAAVPGAQQLTTINFGVQQRAAVQAAVNTWVQGAVAAGVANAAGNVIAPGAANVQGAAVQGRNGHDLQSDALHEIGHGLGLHHPNQGGGGLNNYFARNIVVPPAPGQPPQNQILVGNDGNPGTADDVVQANVRLANYALNIQNNQVNFAATPAVQWTPASVGLDQNNNLQRNFNIQGGVTEAALVQGAFANELQQTLGSDDLNGLQGIQAGRDGFIGLNPQTNMNDDFVFFLDDIANAPQGTVADITFFLFNNLQALQGPVGQTRGLRTIPQAGPLQILLDEAQNSDLIVSATQIWPQEGQGSIGDIGHVDIFFSLNNVPEPSSIYLLGIGMLAGSVMLRRKNQNS